MVSNEEIRQCLLAVGGVRSVEVSGDGYHYQLTIVSDNFLGMSAVLRQKWVYAQLKDYITSGRLHALNMKTWTQIEWEKQRG